MASEHARVLVVDDDARSRAGLAALLSNGSLEVVTAGSGTEALRRCLQMDFAVILLDVRMPEMDGYETAASIHARPRSSCVPIIFLTGDSPDFDRLRAYEIGAVDFLRKPVEPLVLRAKVRVFVELWQRRREVEITQRRLRELEAREAREQAAAERRRSGAELRTVLSRQALILEALPVALFARDHAHPWRVTWASENVDRVLGVSSSELLADPDAWRARVHAEDREGALGALRQVDEEGATSVSYPWRLPDGSWRWILEHVAGPGPDAEVGDLHGVWVDIHEQKRMEEALRQANEALDRRVAERTLELAAALEELESFSYSVSHDLRAPLRSIHAYGRILAEESGGALSPAGEHARARLDAAVNRMSQLIDDLLRLSRVSRARLEREPIDVSALAADIGAALREQEPDHTVELVIQPGLQTEGDRGLLQIALENLIGNAWKFTRPVASPRVEVGSRPGAPNVLYVRDNGVGFDMTYATQLFRPFHRLHPYDKFAGTGIGLATVRRIVQRHGGEVWPESAPGQGATFYFTMAPSPGGSGFRP